MFGSVEGAIATPTLWYPGQSEEELNYEIHLMVQRSIATRQFLKGEIDFSTFMDKLETFQIEMDHMVAGWAETLPTVWAT